MKYQIYLFGGESVVVGERGAGIKEAWLRGVRGRFENDDKTSAYDFSNISKIVEIPEMKGLPMAKEAPETPEEKKKRLELLDKIRADLEERGILTDTKEKKYQRNCELLKKFQETHDRIPTIQERNELFGGSISS